jgi:hypothetical protein
MTTLHHGAHTKFSLHIGQCFTDDRSAADSYACQGRAGEIATISADFDGLRVVELDAGYDRDANSAPGDDDAAELAAEHGADVIIYDDEDIRGQSHRCWRLLTEAALGAIGDVSTTAAE